MKKKNYNLPDSNFTLQTGKELGSNIVHQSIIKKTQPNIGITEWERTIDYEISPSNNMSLSDENSLVKQNLALNNNNQQFNNTHMSDYWLG